MPGFESTSIDTVRAYWDARPCNIRHSPSAIGTRQYFEEVEARKYFVEPHIPIFAEFNRWGGKRVLEIGCGIGTDTISFARAGARVTAVDLSAESVALATRRAEVFGLQDRIQFHVANAEDLANVVRPERYDLVYSFGVIHHTPHPRRIVEQVSKHYASDETVFKCMVYHKYAWKVLSIVLREGRGALWKSAQLVARSSEAESGCPVTYTYSIGDARRLLESHFKIEDARVEHIFPFRIKDYVQHKYVRNWHFRTMPKPIFRLLERRFGWHLLLTASPL